jgi:photosynthetic reaction center cytochrome c subunit/tetratricopeptide repeat protein
MTRHVVRALLLCLLVPIAASAQIPQKFENLQVLPKDIPRDSLIATMRRVAISLGVRCNYCHTGGDGQSLQGVDFKSDDKPAKKKARFMFAMTDTLNRVTLASLPDRADPPIRVQCVTCHRGSPLPRTLAATLVDVDQKLGVDSAIARYRSLRETAMESGRYDFSELSLSEVARTLAQEGKTADAVRIAELNAEVHANGQLADVELADLYARNGDKDKAIAKYRAVLARQPNNPIARRGLQQLGVNP